jgi:hypothetical protein
VRLRYQRGEVTLVREADAMGDVDDRQFGLGKEPLRVLDPTHNHVLVRHQTCGLPEQACKMSKARVCDGSQLSQR